eukprot:19073-Eustigmatos_ZCMA.PRE.1
MRQKPPQLLTRGAKLVASSQTRDDASSFSTTSKTFPVHLVHRGIMTIFCTPSSHYDCARTSQRFDKVQSGAA